MQRRGHAGRSYHSAIHVECRTRCGGAAGSGIRGAMSIRSRLAGPRLAYRVVRAGRHVRALGAGGSSRLALPSARVRARGGGFYRAPDGVRYARQRRSTSDLKSSNRASHTAFCSANRRSVSATILCSVDPSSWVSTIGVTANSSMEPANQANSSSDKQARTTLQLGKPNDRSLCKTSARPATGPIRRQAAKRPALPRNTQTLSKPRTDDPRGAQTGFSPDECRRRYRWICYDFDGMLVPETGRRTASCRISACSRQFWKLGKGHAWEHAVA